MAAAGSGASVAARSSLWQHRDFMRLWIGQSVSRLGDQFTGFALPVLAVLALNPSAAEMGILAAAGTLPFLLFGLLVGVWVDRLRKRPVLIVGDLGRGILVGTVALLGFARLLQMSYLYVFAFAVGVLTVFFDIAYQAYLPVLVPRETLTDANSKLETTSSLAQVGGPSLAGVVVEVLTAPAAMLFDAVSFLFSTGTLLRIRKPEPDPRAFRNGSISKDLREGLRVVLGEPRLRMIAGCTATSNFFSNVLFALFVLYAINELGFSPLALGFVQAIGAAGGVFGAILATRIAGRIGVGWAIILGVAFGSFVMIPVPLVTGPLAFWVISAGLAGALFGGLVYNINQVSFRQTIVPVRLQGRLNATMRTIVWGTIPIGGLVGGFLGEALGIRTAMLIGALGGCFSFLWVLLSPVRDIITMPEPAA